MFLHDQANRLWGARQEGMKEGEAKGRAKGIAEGEVKGKTETARKLHARGMANEEIADITGLSIDELKKL